MKILNKTDTPVIVPADQLVQHPDNPRRGNTHAIEQSIIEHGFYGALTVQVGTNYILTGNHRFVAGRACGMVGFPVFFVDVDPAEAKRLLLVDNRARDVAGEDEREMIAMLQGIAASYGEAELRGTGYDGDDLMALVERVEAGDAEDVKRSGGLRETQSSTSFRIGEHVFTVGADVWLSWFEDLRFEAGFTKKEIQRELLCRLLLNNA